MARSIAFIFLLLMLFTLHASASNQFFLSPQNPDGMETEILTSSETPSRIYCAQSCAWSSKGCNVIDMRGQAKEGRVSCKQMKVSFGDTTTGSEKPPADGQNQDVMRVTRKLNVFLGLNAKDPIDGNWGSWVDAGACAVSCGGGTKQQTRRCDNPSPLHGGLDCSGNAGRGMSCSVTLCPTTATPTTTAGPSVFHHDTEQRMHVNGFESARSYVRIITYSDAMATIENLIQASSRCQQHFKYESMKAELTIDGDACWVSRDVICRAYYPSGASQNVCYCSGVEFCCCKDGSCNTDLDNSDISWGSDGLTDEGYFTKKDHLPITEMRFGDTGRSYEYAYYTLGPL